jgi:drug/metabolite transporter (DMT)-like permease
MNGIIAAIYASFTLAIGETSLKKSYRDFEPSIAFMFDAMMGVVFWIPLALLFGGSLGNFFIVLPYAIASAILSEAFYFWALSKGQLSITAIILSTYPIYTIGFSYFINQERLNGHEMIFVGIAIAGTLLSYLPSKLSRKELKKSGAIIWPVLAAVAVGFSDTISKSVINKTSAFDFLLALAVVQLPIALIYLKLEKQSYMLTMKNVIAAPYDYFHSLVGGLFTVAGTGLLWVSFNYTLASVAAPIIATSGALIVLFATLFMDERMTWKNALGIAMIFIGVLGISRSI